MNQRGVSIEEINVVLKEGWEAKDSKEGTFGKVYVFPYNAIWEGKYFEEKEVSVYYRYEENNMIILTVKARYGKDFLKEESRHENRV